VRQGHHALDPRSIGMHMQVTRTKGVHARARLQMNQLRQEAKAVFSPSNFAQSAKLERKANAIEKSLKQDNPSADYLFALASTMVRAIQVPLLCSATKDDATVSDVPRLSQPGGVCCGLLLKGT
jgi:hypothetical protein